MWRVNANTFRKAVETGGELGLTDAHNIQGTTWNWPMRSLYIEHVQCTEEEINGQVHQVIVGGPCTFLTQFPMAGTYETIKEWSFTGTVQLRVTEPPRRFANTDDVFLDTIR